MTDEQWKQARETMQERNIQRQNSALTKKNKKEEIEAMKDVGVASDIL